MAGTASADTLREALVSTYRANPTLTPSARALKATDANVAIARAAGRPQVSGTVGVNRDLTRSGVFDVGRARARLCRRGRLSYPLVQGGSRQEHHRGGQDPGRGRPRDAARGRRRRLHRSGRRLHGRDPRPRDRRAQRTTTSGCSTPTWRRRATGSRSATSPAPTSPSPKRACRSAARNLPTAQGRLTASEENYRRVIGQRPGALAAAAAAAAASRRPPTRRCGSRWPTIPT